MVPDAKAKQLLAEVRGAVTSRESRFALDQALSRWTTGELDLLRQLLRDWQVLPDERLAGLEAQVLGQLDRTLPGNPRADDGQPALHPTLGAAPDATMVHEVADATLEIASKTSNASILPSRASTADNRFQEMRFHAKGGLGTVFIAKDAQFSRDVAVKEIQGPYAHDASCRHRFVLEAEVTGRLEHPGIVPVYALGAYPDGRPYYAMRFIHGDSLHAAVQELHARKNDAESGEYHLALRGLLTRFLSVCNALAYAHSRGILHRDLKPANIMLGPYGETLVVDWGLAKEIGAQEQASGPANLFKNVVESQDTGPMDSTQTRQGELIGTPAFMSPEQALGDHQSLTPESDIFSLGAILYMILAGRPPYVAASLPKVLQQCIAVEFPSPRKLDPGIAPPLEAICLKAMSKEKGDRYASAKLLADDLEKWLADEPVSAWREPWTVRAARWIRRHRALVTGAAATVLVTSFSLAVVLVLMANAKHQVDDALAKAERNFGQLQVASNELMEIAEQWLARSPQEREIQQVVLKKGLDMYEQFLSQEPTNPRMRNEIARTHLRVAQIHRALGQNTLAVDQCQRATEHFQTLLDEFPDDATYVQSLAESQNWKGESLRRLDRSAEALASFRDAADHLQQLHEAEPANHATILELARVEYNQGLAQHALGQREEAAKSYQDAIGLLQQDLESTDNRRELRHHLARCFINQGVLQKDSGEIAQALASYRQAAELLSGLIADHSQVVDYQVEFATAQMNVGNLLVENRANPLLAGDNPLDAAEAAFSRASQDFRGLARDFGAVTLYRKELANCLNGLGSVKLTKRNTADARTAFQEAREIYLRLIEENEDATEYHSRLALTVANLSLVERKEDVSLAKSLLREAIDHQSTARQGHPEVVRYGRLLQDHMLSLARLLVADKDADGALEAIRSIEQIDRANVETLVRGAKVVSQCLAIKKSALPEGEAGVALIKSVSAQGIQLLQTACQQGFHDADRLEKDADFLPLLEQDGATEILGKMRSAAK